MRFHFLAVTILIFQLAISFEGFAQRIGSVYCYGGSGIGGGCADGDDMMGFIQTLDGGYVFVTNANVGDGDLTGNYGSCDVWIVKLNSQGIIQWQTNVGGSDVDLGYSVCETPDSCYYVVLYTSSTDGMMNCNSGGEENYILKFDRYGTILHQRCFGGSGTEMRPHLITTSDFGCIVTSTTGSTNGDVSGFHGGTYDFWIVRFDSTLNIVWQHCYGGSSVDCSGAIANDNDGGFIFAGRARSTDGDLNLNYGIYDFWTVKIDSVGTIQWSQLLGGSQWDVPYSIVVSADSNIYVVGNTSSSDFTVTGNHGSMDAWVVKFDHYGNIIWKNCYGGALGDYCYHILQSSDDNFIISGITMSNDGDVSGNRSNSSGWIFKIDSSGTLLWQKCTDFSPNEMVNAGNGNEMFIASITSFNSLNCNRGLITMGELKPSNFISGKVFVDYNSNSQLDGGEPIYQNAFITSVKSGIDTVESYTNLNGAYWNYPDTGNYTTSLPNGVRYYTFQPAQHLSSFSSTSQYDTVNFALTPIPGIHDLELMLLPVTGTRPGGNTHLQLHYKNAGTDTSSGTVYLIKDSLLNYSSATPIPDGIVGDSIYWNYASLLPLESRNIELFLGVPIPPIVLPGDTLTSFAEILPVVSDSTPVNNFASLDEIVSGSYDPNDKIVISEDTISIQQAINGDYIFYLIRFQNTGNSAATTIIIQDSLNSYLDPTSLEIISASHVYQMMRDDEKVFWVFNNIQLPDSSTDELNSHGFICFRIKAKNSIIPTTIYNYASIFFDNNLAVETNSAKVVVTNMIGITENFNQCCINLHPNPTSGKTEVILEDATDVIESIKLNNTLGESVLVSRNSNYADLSSLPQGIYFLEVSTKKLQRFTKLVVKK